MLKNTVSGLTASKLRLILIVGIIALLGIAVALFILVRGILTNYAAEVQQITGKSQSSSNDVASLTKLKEKLETDRAAVERTKDLVAESKEYQYQDQIIKDINSYATKAGISISGYAFDSTSSAPGSAPSGGAAAPAPAAGGATPPGSGAISGLKSISVTITPKSPLKYESLMNFIHYIEQNLTKMQLAGISFSKDDKGQVTANALTIEVYVR